jgi:hypothetical protein
MRCYLCILERSQNSLSRLYCAFLLILHRVLSAKFYEVIIGLNQNLGYYFVVVVYLEFWFIVFVRWMKC